MPDNQESPSKELEQKGGLKQRIEYFTHPLGIWTARERDIISCLKDAWAEIKATKALYAIKNLCDEDLVEENKSLQEQLTATQQALDSAVEALKFYADIDNTCYDVNFDRSYEYWYDGSPDACKIAKAALASIKE